MRGNIGFDTGHTVATREIRGILGFAGVLSIGVDLAIGGRGAVALGFLQALVGIFELDGRIDGVGAGAEVGVHVSGYIGLQRLERALYVAIVLIGRVYGITQLNHVLVVGPERKYANHRQQQCYNQQIHRFYGPNFGPQMMQLALIHTLMII